MAKTILIPTDFSVKLLKLVCQAMDNNQDEPVNLVLFHRIDLTNSITDLLFYSKEKILRPLETREFKDSCKIILSKYESSINSFRIELFTGFNGNAFRNFLDGNRIDEVYRPVNYKMKLKDPRSLDILPLLEKCPVPTVDVTINSYEHRATREIEQLADLFFQSVTK